VNNRAHILQDEWLVSYAAGSLTPARSLMISSYAAFHEKVRDKIRDAETIGGSLLENITPAAVDDALLDEVLGRLDAMPRSQTRSSKINGKLFPPPLADFIGADASDLHWHFMAPGIRYVKLWKGAADERLWLLRAKGGITIPEHGHTGDEWTLILKGSYETELGRYRTGDIDVSDETTIHQPVIQPDEECICLVMTEGPIQTKSTIARIAQSITGL